MSAALMVGANASGQIIFTDIEDLNITDLGVAEIDIDNNGTIDYTPAAGANAAAIYAGEANAFVGFDVGGYFYASNLSAGDIIDETSAFTSPSIRADLNFNGCYYSNSQFCDGVVDGFVGLAFQIDGNTHFGWMQVDVAADGSGFILKSYAYEATPDTAIAAGDDALSLEDNIIEGLTSFVANNALTISARNPLENVTIHAINGQVVVSQKLANTTETINLSALSTGVYIATVETEGKVKAIKFVK